MNEILDDDNVSKFSDVKKNLMWLLNRKQRNQ